MEQFKLISDYSPAGDQPRAIDFLSKNIEKNVRHQVLLGVTGSGKTFTMANVIEKIQKPTLVIAQNKTLAAQLYSEFKTFFPENAVRYFVSYYDYYQPEAYLPHTDTYIEKDASINEEIDKLRHAATSSLLERRDIIIVASVSCIYGLGSPEAYHGLLLRLETAQTIDRDKVLSRLIEIRYKRNDVDFQRGTFRVRGDIVEIIPAYEDKEAVRLEFFGDLLENIYIIDPLTGEKIKKLDFVAIYPGSHYVTTRETIEKAMKEIKIEMMETEDNFLAQKKYVEAQRIEQRTMYDLEMMLEIGYCKGIENYSRHITGRQPGKAPPTLIDYFPENSLIIIDESHVTVPQLNGMYKGDRSRKESLVNFGFRLPSAFDNRPLQFEEFETIARQVVFVSATPGPYEMEKAKGFITEQIVRPTGLIDPEIEVRPVNGQVDNLFQEIKLRSEMDEKILVTTLTKRFAEDLTEHLSDLGLKVRYLHSDIDTLERIEIIRELRMGKFDTLVGINLLREGLDIPEVSLVAILDADKEGFLRSTTSLIQTSGRAARNLNGKVIMYADTVTGSMKAAIDETGRRRKKQEKFNKINGITPTSIKKNIAEIFESVYESNHSTVPLVREDEEKYGSDEEMMKVAEKLEKEMKKAAQKLDFEKAAQLRDRINELKEKAIGI
ncbi:MAG TPA: excinuclease ABC subunit UvrB [Nitrospinota bacterium]|nr:excinuclease ABC subunit UvrB [Nitrospinota bacterium]